jgi:hypothetical protein
MSLDQLEQKVLSLPREERRKFARWFYEHENEIVEPHNDDEISPAVRAEILRRRDEALAHPERMEPWDGTVERVKARLDEIRRQKAAAR